MFRAQVLTKTYPTQRHVLRSESFTAYLRKAFSETLTESCCESCQALISRENKTDLPKEIRINSTAFR